MDILLCFDDAYSPYACTVMYSVCINNTGSHTFYIITNYISDENKTKITRFSEEMGAKVIFLYVSDEETKDLPIGRGTANTYVNIAAYFRVFMFKLLPANVEKVLYLDCDVIVDADISKLWNTTMPKNIMILAVEDDNKIAQRGPIRLGYDSRYSYFNSGVILVNVKGIRNRYSHDDIANYILLSRNKILFHDQDVLNALFHEYVNFIPLRYNVMDVNYIKGHKLNNRYKEEKEAIYNPAIIHFSGPIKPWFVECNHPLKDRFLKAIKQTPYYNFTPYYKYVSLKMKFQMLIKKSVKFILEMLHIRNFSYISLKR